MGTTARLCRDRGWRDRGWADLRRALAAPGAADDLEPVREVHERAKRLIISLIIANRIRATDVLARFSRLRARRRQRVSQASVLSTIQRFGSTTKPRTAAARRTMRSRQCPLHRAALAARGPWYPASAKMARTKGNSARVR